MESEALGLLNLMDELGLSQQGETSAIIRIFDYMEMTERIIDEWVRKYPDKGLEIWCMFGVALSPLIPSTAANYDQLFATHVRQLCRMIVQGDDLNRPTLVEMACTICKVGEHVPVHHEALWAVLSDQETMAAFRQEPSTLKRPDPGSWWWDELTIFCRRAYRDSRGDERAILYARSVRDREHCWEGIRERRYPDVWPPADQIVTAAEPEPVCDLQPALL